MPKPLRLAEQYLIRAEAYCNNGEYGRASADLTALRQARFISGGSITLTEKNWQQAISDERVRELYMEGFRLHDLKRWGWV
ncbi:RagB/SusD family nutrient uptake outer membrane protein, partial [Klebsiella pneumoniae]|uniref:RagB/SusD family nutrient uptake outer membrane protein n=1 Tax=Klebsiella pneumoniae TaxID=573 RepID=UPI0025A207B4